VAEKYPLRDTTAMHKESGSFWLRYFSDADRMRTMYASAAALNEDFDSNVSYDKTVTSLASAEPVRKLSWAPVSVNVDDIVQSKITYGSGRSYGDGLLYGDTQREWVVEVPFKRVECLVDTPGLSSIVLYEGIDFVSDESLLRFRFDPSTLASYTNAEGTFILLWAYGYELDASDLYKRHGITLDFRQVSSARYRTMLYAMMQARIKGPTVESISTALCCAYGVPQAEETSTVEVVTDSWIATDKEIIHYDLGQLVVSAGDTVYPGQPMTDAIKIGTLQELSGVLTEVGLGAEYLAGAKSTVVFENTDKALSAVTGTESTSVSFDLGGDSADVAAVLSALNENDPNLADYLDRRRAPYGPPEASDLPSTVNPYDLVAEYLADRLICVYVDSAKVEYLHPTAYLRRIRDMLPPTTGLLIVIDTDGTYSYTAISSV